jgi:hypothetical protein
MSVMMPLPFSTEALLDAGDAIAHAAGGDGLILNFSRGQFVSVAMAAPSREWHSEQAAGTSIFRHMREPDVLANCRRPHHAVWPRGQAALAFEYRCDTPGAERHMRMSSSLIPDGLTPIAVPYQSVSEIPRVALPLFAADLLVAREAFRADDPIVKPCSYCQKVSWPVGAADKERESIEAVEYYRRGGGSAIAIGHAVCEACRGRAMVAVSRSIPNPAGPKARIGASGPFTPSCNEVSE